MDRKKVISKRRRQAAKVSQDDGTKGKKGKKTVDEDPDGRKALSLVTAPMDMAAPVARIVASNAAKDAEGSALCCQVAVRRGGPRR